MFVFTMTETRASVLYRRNAKRQALKDGVAAVIPKEYEKPDLKQLLKVSSTRPLSKIKCHGRLPFFHSEDSRSSSLLGTHRILDKREFPMSDIG